MAGEAQREMVIIDVGEGEDVDKCIVKGRRRTKEDIMRQTEVSQEDAECTIFLPGLGHGPQLTKEE